MDYGYQQFRSPLPIQKLVKAILWKSLWIFQGSYFTKIKKVF